MRYKKFNSKKLNLGSGNEYRVGWVNIDVDPRWKVDILADIEKGIPLKDNSIEEVFVKHVMEHIDPRKFEFVMSEIWRVCKKGARITIYCPYFSCSITYKTADHITSITYFTFSDNEKFNPLEKKLFYFRESFGYESRVFSRLRKILNPLLSFLPNSFPLIYERAFCWIFPMEEIKVILEVKK
ncbi:MAG: methyltransferase domain-containing protein [archaeon]